MIMRLWSCATKAKSSSRSGRRTFLILPLLAPLQFLAPSAQAGDQPSQPKPSDPEAIHELVVEVQELRARLHSLELKLAAANGGDSTAIVEAPPTPSTGASVAPSWSCSSSSLRVTSSSYWTATSVNSTESTLTSVCDRIAARIERLERSIAAKAAPT